MSLVFVPKIKLFIRLLVLIHLNKMELLKENIDILDVARTLMIYMSISKYLWSDGVLRACYLINRMSSSVFNKSSLFSCLYANKTPFSVTPRVFRCTCFVHDLSPALDKLSPRFIKCDFVGYYRT